MTATKDDGHGQVSFKVPSLLLMAVAGLVLVGVFHFGYYSWYVPKQLCEGTDNDLRAVGKEAEDKIARARARCKREVEAARDGFCEITRVQTNLLLIELEAQDARLGSRLKAASNAADEAERALKQLSNTRTSGGG